MKCGGGAQRALRADGGQIWTFLADGFHPLPDRRLGERLLTPLEPLAFCVDGLRT